MEFLNSPFAGPAILLGVIFVLCIFMASKAKRDRDAAMQKYEQDMAAYQAAMENHSSGLKFGVTFVPPDIIMEAQSDAVAPYFGPSAPMYGGVASLVAVGGDDQVELFGVDERTAAMVMAILCEELGGDPAKLHFHSIKAV